VGASRRSTCSRTAALSAAILPRCSERGELDPQVSWRGPWTRLTEALDAFRGRRVQGKAVLDIDGVAPRPSA
jgi:hypothetical protein